MCQQEGFGKSRPEAVCGAVDWATEELCSVTRLFKKASAVSPPLYQTLVAFVNYFPHKLLTSSRFMLRPNLTDPPWERPAMAAGRPHHAPD